jgi:hypothetical protein
VASGSITWPTLSFSVGGYLSGAEPKPVPLDDYDADAAPDLQGEVLGWRDWKVTAYGDLTSRNTHAVWRPGPNKALCSFAGAERDHLAPQGECDCGFYGLHEPNDDVLFGCSSARTSSLWTLASWGSGEHNDNVRGLFAAWGKLCVHATGFRSEWAEVVCLVHPDPTPRVQRASNYYDVPLFSDQAEALAYAIGRGYGLVPDDMRPAEERKRPRASGADIDYVEHRIEDTPDYLRRLPDRAAASLEAGLGALWMDAAWYE